MGKKVYILGYQQGEYSDYECCVVAVCASEEACERIVDMITDFRAEKQRHNDARLVAVAEAGLDSPNEPSYSLRGDNKAWKAFYARRREFMEAWLKENPAPKAPKDMHNIWPGDLDFYAWDAEFSVAETEIIE